MGILLSLYLYCENPVRDIKIKKRYAYLVIRKRRNFYLYTQRWHGDFYIILWAAITIFVCTGFVRLLIQNVAFLVPHSP